MPSRAQPAARAVVASGEQTNASQALQLVTREIDNRLAIIQASAAAGIDPDRLKLVALTAFTRSPDLMRCDPVSVARAIVEAGQLGLEPTGLLGGAYLVPRGGQATLMVGYRGLVILAKRSGEVQRVEARVVRAEDDFEYGYGLDPYLRHTPSRSADPGELTYAYAVIVYRSGERQFDVMSKAEIEAVRGRSSAGRAGPWVTDYFEMCKKTVLRRLLKLAPLTVEVAARLDDLDPEVGPEDAPARPGRGPGRQAELRRQLQAQLEGEYGTAPGSPTTNGSAAAGTRDDAQGGAAGGTGTAVPGGAEPEQAAAAGTLPAAAPAAPERPPAQPTPVGQVLAATCGVSHEGLGVGPCVLPAGHDQHPWQDSSGEEHGAQGEHSDASGMRWTMPRKGAR